MQQAESYREHPIFQAAMQNLQKGEWEKGLSQLERLMQAYPLDVELRALRQEMQLRARVDQDEREDNALIRRRKARNLLIRGTILVLLVLLGMFVVRNYSRWINEQMVQARQTIEYQMVLVELATKFRDAQDYLRAGQTDTALTLLKEIEAVDPGYAGLADLMKSAQRQKSLEDLYNQALVLKNQGDLTGALQVFKQLEGQEPYFRDVKAQIQSLERQTVLGDMLAQANAAFDSGDWIQAASRYEELYLFNPDFETRHVEDRLFESYIRAAEVSLHNAETLEALQAAEEYYRKALALRPQDPEAKKRQQQVKESVEERLFRAYIDLAQKALAEEPDSLDALRLARGYFREALKIKPFDQEIALQGELANLFVDAQDYIRSENWGAAIDNLEKIYSQEQGYAGGTARQSLYEAYVARGDDELAIGDFDSALVDFQRAAVLANDDPSSSLRLYEIQLKIAETTGLLGDYAGAVQLYNVAIEFAGLKQRAQGNSGNLLAALEEAEKAATAGDLRKAFLSYREAVAYSTEVFETVEHVVKSGEYLSSIALEYNSTVSLIARVNNLANPNLIITGQVLLIPILP